MIPTLRYIKLLFFLSNQKDIYSVPFKFQALRAVHGGDSSESDRQNLYPPETLVLGLCVIACIHGSLGQMLFLGSDHKQILKQTGSSTIYSELQTLYITSLILTSEKELLVFSYYS